jgi:flagellar protein FlaJ
MRFRKKYVLRDIYRDTYKMLLIVCSVVFLSLLVISILLFLGIVTFFPKENAVDFLVIGILSFIGPVGFYNAHQAKKKKRIEDRLPDFLREIGSSTASGTTVFDAIRMAAKGEYGLLSKEIKVMASRLSWGISIREVLQNFSRRLKSKPVERAVLTINQSLDMGGNTSDTFYAAAKEIEQIKMVEMQRKAEMSMYSLVILISFFVFLAVILLINATIFEAFFELQEKVGAMGALAIAPIDKNTLKYAFYSFIFVQSIGAGLLGGFMMDGTVSSGVRYSFTLVVISYIVLRFMM